MTATLMSFLQGLSLDQSLLLPLLGIIWINLLLSGDNAVVIALVCRRLPQSQQRAGLVLGSLAAVVLRIAMAFVVSYRLGRDHSTADTPMMEPDCFLRWRYWDAASRKSSTKRCCAV